jgi:hypothetical protein
MYVFTDYDPTRTIREDHAVLLIIGVTDALGWLLISLDASKASIAALYLVGGVLTVLGIWDVVNDINKRHKNFLGYQNALRTIRSTEQKELAESLKEVRSVPPLLREDVHAKLNLDAFAQFARQFERGERARQRASMWSGIVQEEYLTATAPTGGFRDHRGSAALVLGVVLQTVASIMGLY